MEKFSSVEEIVEFLVDRDWNKIIDNVIGFVRSRISESKANGVVVGLSGGVDSAASFALAIKALGTGRVRTLVMPDQRVTPKEDISDAIELSKKFGVSPHLIEISPIVDVYTSTVPVYEESDVMSVGNLRARIRMSLLYYYANKYNLMVLGTGDRSEILIGYFTKYGDGGVDILPIGCFYKSQVRKIAEVLSVPKRIAYKPSSPRLVPGHLAERELGITYDIVDAILHLYFDRHLSKEETCSIEGIECSHFDKVLERYEATRHKRSMPPSPGIDIWF
ncbi:MAG: NAD+ synthase [Desulfurococcales archaeon]|nr:NAD+ synthase [Desulfurococcales archaeon]